MTGSFVKVSGNHVCDSGRGHEMIEAIAVIWNEKKVAATVFQNVGDLILVMDEIGLVLNHMATEDRTKMLINRRKV